MPVSSDFFGRLIKPGDRIVYATRYSCTAIMNEGPLRRSSRLEQYGYDRAGHGQKLTVSLKVPKSATRAYQAGAGRVVTIDSMDRSHF